MNCDRISHNLLIGSSLLDENEIGNLRALGITAILSLQSEEDVGKNGIAWEEKAALAAKLTFCNVSVNDFDKADLRRKLPACVSELDAMLKAGHVVYLHCTAGVSRSPTVAAAYLHRYLGWSLQRALVHVREARDCSPDGEAIHNAWLNKT
jgi:protein-tyrosine phosphatase